MKGRLGMQEAKGRIELQKEDWRCQRKIRNEKGILEMRKDGFRREWKRRDAEQ